MKTHLLLIPVITGLLVACASTETVKEARGQGISRLYQNAYEHVYNATLSAAKAKNLEVVETDMSAGKVVLSHGVTLWSWGERIAIFLKRATESSTEVEIVSKPVMAPLNFPPDWQQILLEQIAVELRTGR